MINHNINKKKYYKMEKIDNYIKADGNVIINYFKIKNNLFFYLCFLRFKFLLKNDKKGLSTVDLKPYKSV